MEGRRKGNLMYKIHGADGKEYGPVSADVVRQWIAQGRANAQTTALAEGTAVWKPLNEFPEFAAELAAKRAALSPEPPPTFSGAAASAAAAEILAGDYHLEIGRCIGRGWDLVMKHFWLTVGAAFLVHII